jgi:hypothetical protein
VCPHLEEGTVTGRRWACALRRELGSWSAVHADARYRRDVRPFWDGFAPALDCGTWPTAGATCATCGQVGSHG